MTKKIMAELIKELEKDLADKNLKLKVLERELDTWRRKNSSKVTLSK